jgi:hypothetical protein
MKGTNFSGRWRINSALSHFPGAAPQSMTVEIEHREPHLSQSVVSTTDAGEERVTFFFRTDGEPSVNLMRGVEVQTRAHWDGGELIIESEMKTAARDFRFRDCWSIAADGKLVMEHRGDDLAGQRAVFDCV